ncbi:MAG: hypothetical protein CVV23_00710 [Ignavibacteriae bacterium HGW-Ignavibacteriae-2]|jgi:two-component SAPR family response regulator|nr:hypothetical protein [Bacteroidota bacterium]PKL90405.1 MAG: hypothetical protein CVV23_00710 [Ignavibacteriae bacterium HGW-Ignavibacteriae-2]
MQIVAITTDKNLINILRKSVNTNECELKFYQQLFDPLDVMSFVCSTTPPVLFVDDDCLKPNTAHILKSIKKVNKGIKLVFFTSDSSLELGREISPLGVHFYGIKPVGEEILTNILNSIRNQLLTNNNSYN